MSFATVLGAGLLAWNNVVDVVRPRWAYVPTNLALTAALLRAAQRRGLGRRELRLEAHHIGGGARWGLGAAGAVSAALATAAAVPSLRPVLHDERAIRLRPAEVALDAVVRIPLGTVVLEEVAFRGVLLAALTARHGTRSAVVRSSAVFGLWHVAPTLQALRTNDPALSKTRLAGGVAAGVVVTAGAGGVFSALAVRSRSLVAPAIAHVATNTLALLTAWTVHHRRPS